MQSVLIVEDHPLVAELMRDFLAGWSDQLRTEVCGDVGTTRAFLVRNRESLFRIFLDLDVPGAYGLSLAKEIREAGLHSKCCVVTALDRPELITEIKALGFLGYIVKACPYVLFVRSVHAVLSGEPTFPDSALPNGCTPVRLTKRQEQLLDQVRLGQSSKQIATSCFLSEGTVNNSINAALKALGVASRGQAVAKAIELGLLRINANGDARRDMNTKPRR